MLGALYIKTMNILKATSQLTLIYTLEGDLYKIGLHRVYVKNTFNKFHIKINYMITYKMDR